MASASAIHPTLPQLSLSLDIAPSTAHDQGSRSETTTLSDHYDNIASSSSSIRSCSTSSSTSNDRGNKPRKRVRFEESVCWSYFDDNAINGGVIIRPPLEKKPSLWQRLRSRNSFSDDVLGGVAHAEFRHLKREDGSLDLSKKAAGSRQASGMLYSVQQPLRESTGRRYTRADARPCWTASPVAPRGDWNDLLSGLPSQQSPLVA